MEFGFTDFRMNVGDLKKYICSASEILKKSIRFSLKCRPSERFHWPEMFQIKAEISPRTNVKLIFHKNVGWQGYQWIS